MVRMDTAETKKRSDLRMHLAAESRADGWPLQTIADLLEVSKRTIVRDLARWDAMQANKTVCR